MNAELVINLWAIYDASTGLVNSLAGRAYNIHGSDKEKLALLKNLSATDYVTAKRYNVPKRFKVVCPDGTEKTGVTFLNLVNNPNAQLFEDIFRNIESELPPIPDFSTSEFQHVKQKLPDDPLCIITVLYEDEVGGIRPIITDEDRVWVDQHEKRVHGI